MSTKHKIEPRFGCESYISKSGDIIIKQERPESDGNIEESIIILHPEESDILISHLRQHMTAIEKGVDFLQEPES